MGWLPGAPRRSRIGTPGALAASVLVHGALVAVAARSFSAQGAAAPVHYEVALVDPLPHAEALAFGEPGAAGTRPPAPPRDSRTPGPARDPRPDTQNAGRGGTTEATQKALHLSDSVEGLTLEPDPTRFTPSSQLSRLDTDDERASREDRRTTPHPMELSFVASGPGTRALRLDPSPTDPAAGALGAIPVQEGAKRGELEPPSDGFFRADTGSSHLGAARVSRDALGIDRGTRRADFRRTAAIAVARPSIRESRASVATTNRGRASDTVDSTQAVASFSQALLTASTAGGTPGHGPGGTDASGNPGTNGTTGEGSRARASGEGGTGADAADLGIRGYAAAVTRKVYPYWEDAFPMWARAEGRGGVAVIGVTLSSDGSVRDLRVLRGSGIPEFDHNVTIALEHASPYGPLPAAIRQNGLTLNIAFDATNPAVGRSGPGPGRR